MKIENISVYNFENAIRGMRNPLDSWDKMDSYTCNDKFYLGDKDKELAQKLIKAGDSHSKFLRQIFVSFDIKAAIFFWKELDTYKIGTTANSCSTMHTLMKKELTLDDFDMTTASTEFKWWLEHNLNYFNDLIDKYKETKDINIFYQIVNMLPCSFLQLRTWTGTYANLRNIYHQRKNHKLPQWKILLDTIETLPYAEELICN